MTHTRPAPVTRRSVIAGGFGKASCIDLMSSRLRIRSPDWGISITYASSRSSYSASADKAAASPWAKRRSSACRMTSASLCATAVRNICRKSPFMLGLLCGTVFLGWNRIRPGKPQPSQTSARHYGRSTMRSRRGCDMGIGTGVFLLAAGAILAFAVDYDISGLELSVVGWILMGAGALAILLFLTVWAPGRRVVDRGVVEE